jgi:hypothetical protein
MIYLAISIVLMLSAIWVLPWAFFASVGMWWFYPAMFTVGLTFFAGVLFFIVGAFRIL